MSFSDNLKKTVRIIRLSRSIAISGHINPDGDSLGSLLSLGLSLEKVGKKVYMICQDAVPKHYLLLPGVKKLKQSINQKVDLAIAVDCGSEKLLGTAAEIFKNAKNTLSIDHHEFRKNFTEYSLIDHKVSATSEIIYQLIKKMRIKIDRSIATNLLTSLIVETNSFRLPSTNSRTFLICAELLQTGINFYNISQMTYWSKTRPILKLFNVFYSKIRFEENDKIVWAYLSQKDFQKTSTEMVDADFLIEEVHSLSSPALALLFSEQKDGKIRVGMRSKGKINIARLAEQYGGGGHSDMAGCVVAHKKNIIKEIIKKAKKLL